MHRDTTNLKGSLNAVIGLNKFSGGQLWVEDPKGNVEKAMPVDKLTRDGLRCLEDLLRLPRRRQRLMVESGIAWNQRAMRG